MLLYAPADTVKRPLINKRKRLIWKTLSVINCSILVIILLLTKNNTMSNLLLFGIYTEVIFINPLTYKIFKLPYNNYLNYDLNRNV